MCEIIISPLKSCCALIGPSSGDSPGKGVPLSSRNFAAFSCEWHAGACRGRCCTALHEDNADDCRPCPALPQPMRVMMHGCMPCPGTPMAILEISVCLAGKSRISHDGIHVPRSFHIIPEAFTVSKLHLQAQCRECHRASMASPPLRRLRLRLH